MALCTAVPSTDPVGHDKFLGRQTAGHAMVRKLDMSVFEKSKKGEAFSSHAQRRRGARSALLLLDSVT